MSLKALFHPMLKREHYFCIHEKCFYTSFTRVLHQFYNDFMSLEFLQRCYTYFTYLEFYNKVTLILHIWRFTTKLHLFYISGDLQQCYTSFTSFLHLLYMTRILQQSYTSFTSILYL